MPVLSQFTRDELKNEPQGLDGDLDHPFEGQAHNQIDSSTETRRHSRLPLKTPQQDRDFLSRGFFSGPGGCLKQRMVPVMGKTLIGGFLAFFLLTSSQPSFGFAFRGIQMGKSLPHQMVKCPEFGKNWEPVKDVCYRTDAFTKDLHSIDHLPELDFITITKVQTIHDKVERVIVDLWGNPDFHSVHFDQYYKALTGEYGRRKSYSTQTVENKTGAKIKKINVVWKVKNCTIRLTNIGSDVERGLLTVTTGVYEKHFQGRNKKKKKAAGR